MKRRPCPDWPRTSAEATRAAAFLRAIGVLMPPLQPTHTFDLVSMRRERDNRNVRLVVEPRRRRRRGLRYTLTAYDRIGAGRCDVWHMDEFDAPAAAFPLAFITRGEMLRDGFVDFDL